MVEQREGGSPGMILGEGGRVNDMWDWISLLRTDSPGFSLVSRKAANGFKTAKVLICKLFGIS
jgi:hypothetical protein